MVNQETALKSLWNLAGLEQVYTVNNKIKDEYYERREKCLVPMRKGEQVPCKIYDDPIKLKLYDLLTELEETLGEIL